MPGQQTACGISSSIVVFLLLSSICAMLSLSSPSSRTQHIKEHEQDAQNNGSENGHEQQILVSKYVPNLAMLCVMMLGITAMVILVINGDDLTTKDPNYQSIGRHKIHRKASLWSITAFFVGASVFHINYLIIEISCVSKWNHCDSDVVLSNSVEVVFHIACLFFTGCETIICWIMKPLNFKQSLKVWHGLAVVQAANFAIWFDSILKESGHRLNENVGSFEAYFDFCYTVIGNRSHPETGGFCTKTSIEAQWFVLSIPFLFPLTIEFSLLVSETFLDKIIRSECEHENEATENSSESTPLLSRVSTFVRSTYSAIVPNRWHIVEDQNENPKAENAPAFRNTAGSKIFIMISGIINVVYLLLAILVFVGYKIRDNPNTGKEWQTIENGFTVFLLFYVLFMGGCCIVGILYCRRFSHQDTPTTFLEYLLLFATSGLLLHSMKRLLAFTVHSLNGWNAVYLIAEILDMIQVTLQIVFYYYAKGVKLQLRNDGENADDPSRVVYFRNIMVAMSISNFAVWICDNFFNPEMDPHVTPSSYSIEQWTVFDNVVTPIAIFFRFNSALLFWCISRNIRILFGS